jgi:hypothetical protein
VKPFTLTLNEVFGLSVRYLVPLYQRPYVWGKDDRWVPLWEDITAVLEHQTDPDLAGTPSSHFLGAIVLEQQDTAPGQATEYLVIDGQQRLTTLQLLLAAAANRAARDDAEAQASLLKDLVYNNRFLAEGDRRFKVWPTNLDRDAFRLVLTDGGPPAGAEDDPNNLVQEAYDYFAGAIDEWIDEGDPDADELKARHEALRVALTALLQVVSINLESGDNAQVIFETLNARGTPLLALDLVKNSVLYRARREGCDIEQLYTKHWQPEFDIVDDSENHYWREPVRQGRLFRPRAELFLMHWLTMRLARVVQATELFNEFRRNVLMAAEPPPMDVLIPEMCADAKVLRSFDNQPLGSIERTFFTRLNALDTTTVIPIALLLYRSPEITIDRRRRALQALESWLVRRMICGLTTKNYNRNTARLLVALKENLANADEVIIKELRSYDSDVDRWPGDEDLLRSLTQRDMYGWINQRRVVMLLSAIELEWRRDNKVEDILELPPKLTIEHLMPQSWKKKEWPLPDGIDEADATEARRVRMHRLGNLTLTSGGMNSHASNNAWDVKRKAFSEYGLLLLNKRIEDMTAWNEQTIDTRGDQLAAEIRDLWPGPDAAVWGPVAVPAAVD